MSFSEVPGEISPVIPIKSVSRRRLITALAGGSVLALLGGITLKNVWPTLVFDWTAQPLGIRYSPYMAWTRDLSRVAITSAMDQSTTLLWDYEQQRVVGTLHSSASEFSDLGLAWSPDGQRLLQVTSDTNQNNVTCWNVQTQSALYAVPNTHMTGVGSLCWSPDGQRAAVTGEKVLVMLNATNGQELMAQPLNNEAPLALAWSPSGTRLALLVGNESSREIALLIWDAQTGQQMVHLPQTSVQYDPSDDQADLAWLPGEQELVIAARKRLWLTSLSNAVVLLGSFTGEMMYSLLDLAPDGHTLAVIDADSVAIWDIHERRQEQVLLCGNHPSFLATLRWLDPSHIALIDSSFNRVILAR
jgi:WD40 repeat protein